MKTSIIDRLLQYLKAQEVSMYAFERNCGLANGYLKKQLRGKGNISAEILQRIHQQYPDLDLTWLITGEKRMIQEETMESMVHEDIPPYTQKDIIEVLHRRIASLEEALADKEKIIRLLEKNKRK